VNGVVASSEIPYQASVRVTVRDYAIFGRGHTCGAVILSNRLVATAAHCLFVGTRQRNPFDVHVVMGVLNRFVQSENAVIRHVDRVIVHPEYQRFQSFEHDIGLLVVSCKLRRRRRDTKGLNFS